MEGLHKDVTEFMNKRMQEKMELVDSIKECDKKNGLLEEQMQNFDEDLNHLALIQACMHEKMRRDFRVARPVKVEASPSPGNVVSVSHQAPSASLKLSQQQLVLPVRQMRANNLRSSVGSNNLPRNDPYHNQSTKDFLAYRNRYN